MRRLLPAALLALASACAADTVRPTPPPERPRQPDLPVVAVTSPAADTSVRLPTLVVRGVATSASGVVQRVAYATAADGFHEHSVAVTPGAAVGFAFEVRGLVAGPNPVHVHAYDAVGQRGSDTVTLTYRPNRPPRAAVDSASTWPGVPVTVTVLANDTDPDGDSIRVASVGLPALGRAELELDGRVTYLPAGRTGTDRVPYRVVDQLGDTAAGVLTVTITARAPYALTELVFPARWFQPQQPLGFEFPIEINDAGHVLVPAMYGCSSGGVTCMTRPSDREYRLWTPPAWVLLFPSCWDLAVMRQECQRRYYDLNDAGQVLRSACQGFNPGGGNQKVCSVQGYVLESAGGEVRTTYPHRTTGSGPILRFAAINDQGDAVIDTVLYRGGTETVLRAPDGGVGRGERINARGDVVGFARVAGREVPVLWRGGVATVLEVGDSATASDVNDAGVVVGAAKRAGAWGVFVWENGSTTFVPAPGRVPGRWRNHDSGGASVDDAPPRINSRGQVVYTSVGEETRAYLWERGRSVELGALAGGAEIRAVYSLNDHGEMVVYGRAPGGTRDALFLLTLAP